METQNGAQVRLYLAKEEQRQRAELLAGDSCVMFYFKQT